MLKKDTLFFPFYRFEGQGVKSFIQLFSEYYLFLKLIIILFLLVSIISPFFNNPNNLQNTLDKKVTWILPLFRLVTLYVI